MGWAVLDAAGTPRTGTDLDQFVATAAHAAASGPLAIGFEAPMFIPRRRQAAKLHTGRAGERDRAWIAPAGAQVTAQGIPIAVYVLEELRRAAPALNLTLAFDRLPQVAGEVLLFEAFVSGTGKGKHTLDAACGVHEADAVCAALEFVERANSDQPMWSDIDESEVFSFLGAAMLTAGWSTDPALLREPCLVIKP